MKPFALIAALLPTIAASADPPRVAIERLPAGAVQPQVAVDDAGVAHVIYISGPARAGDLWYARRGPADAAFSEPVRVNSEPGSAVAAGGVRGGQIAVEGGGEYVRVYVAWNGAADGTGHGHADEHTAPMLFTRSTPGVARFEPQRNLMTSTRFLDGGGSVAADGAGGVWVVWHAAWEGGAEGEGGRGVFAAYSSDHGATFSAEQRIGAADLGACACCSLDAASSGPGRLLVLYRAAAEPTQRDMTVLWGGDHGGFDVASFSRAHVDAWRVNACPMSTAWVSAAADRTYLAWETQGQVFCAAFDASSGALGEPMSPHGEGQRESPAFAVNRDGQVLLAWAEGSGQGRRAAWQVFDAQAREVAAGAGRGEDVLDRWGGPAAYAAPDGSFVVLY
jgi:hypothetical protein